MQKNAKIMALLINGVAGTGKDLFIDTLIESNRYHVIRTSIINPVKLIAEAVGWSGAKDNRSRKFLADLATLLDDFNGFPFQKTIDVVEQQLTDLLYTNMLDKDPISIHGIPDKPVIVCVVAREPKHLAQFQDHFEECTIPVKSVLVRREAAEANIPDNHADESVFDFKYDIHLWNVGTREHFKSVILGMDLEPAV
jgi:hypothetical protein